MAQNFEKYMKSERARLMSAQEDLLAEQKMIAQRMQALERELAAIEAYDKARRGVREPVAAKAQGRRARRTSRRPLILKLLQGSDGGLQRGEILERLKLKGDKAAEQSVSNALNAMKKAGQIAAKDRKYRLA